MCRTLSTAYSTRAHAYQILKAGGVDPDHIITMMYNDVPFSKENPFPGELYNHPGDDAQDVYKGVVVDYEKKAVSTENVIKVLTGDESAGGKVLKSTEEDNVFLFFSDHGGPGMLMLPNGIIYTNALLSAIEKMHEKKMYKKFVIYTEACYSGSMFMDIPEDMNVVAVTAANEWESSYGCYCDEEAVVKGKNLETCLGDEFAVSWMEDSEKGEQKTETLEEQFNRVVKAVKNSHVSRYGDMSFVNDVIGEFIGYPTKRSNDVYPTSSVKRTPFDNKMLYLRYKAQHSAGAEQKEWQTKYEEEMAHRKAVDAYFTALTADPRMYQSVGTIKNWHCYTKAVDQFTDIMGYSEYAVKYFNVFANICQENPKAFGGY